MSNSYNTFKEYGKTPRTPKTPIEFNSLDVENQNASQSQSSGKQSKILVIALLVIIVILLVICIVLAVDTYNFRSNVREKSDTIPLNLIQGLDTYLASHCVLHRDTMEGELQDRNGEGITVIRNPVEISLPINVHYTPLINDITGEIEYFSNLDPNGNLVPIPLCQTDFDTSTYTMKNNRFTFDPSGCEFPLPSFLNETDILNLPRRSEPITHRITLTTVEVVAELEEGHTFEFMTYNATVPGPPIRVRVGDWIDLTLINPNTSIHEHSIDFHAMSGPGGGADSLRVWPGQRARTVWQATLPGMFIYHCASGWASDHISKGMYGAIIVEPEFGLPYSDMDIYLGFGELYLHYPLVNNMATRFARPPPNLHNEFDTIKERYEMSDVVMMNGAPFALVHSPIITKIRSVVRAFVVSGGPNHINSFHIIGDSFDRVWLHGDLTSHNIQQNIQTTIVPPGGCAVVDWRHDSPGTFVFVDHSVTRAFVRGNLGLIRACDENDIHCLSGESSETYSAKYTCNPIRYGADNMTLIGNDDCLFCPYIVDEFKYSTVYDETDEIYNYLNQQCNIDMNSMAQWQGNYSRHNDTVSDISNYWRKNRYPGSQQWTLSSRLHVSDPMIGNPRGGPIDPPDDSDDFDDSICIINVGIDINRAIQIEYSIQQNGLGNIRIYSEYDNNNNNLMNGGWISFGRGGDGISTMTDSHVQTVIFDADINNRQFIAHWLRSYGQPTLDDTYDIFPISNPEISINDNVISFSFNIQNGDWSIPPSTDLEIIPMVVAIGTIRNGNTGGIPDTDDMIKHFNKDIVYFDHSASKCVLGGTIK